MNHTRNKILQEVTQVLCLPFEAILVVLETPEIDYFSLDVEGSELNILQTIPWKRLQIKVLKRVHKQ